MGLVDGDERDPDAVEQALERRQGEALGRDIDEVEPAGPELSALPITDAGVGMSGLPAIDRTAKLYVGGKLVLIGQASPRQAA